MIDHSNTELQEKIKLNDLKEKINETENKHLQKISDFLDDHWVRAMQYLRKKGLGKYKRSFNSESEMRLLRRLEKNHDGIRSEKSRKNYIKIYQTVKYLSVDITDFLNSSNKLERTEKT
ncbi:MAG: hypothetical protein GY874_11710 [Desulfobacteraceae bacterium]|nr:hypothetical protein [Desulfobacteraceae bacterium]